MAYLKTRERLECRHAVEAITPALVRFTAPGAERDRQVSAYQKGLRPREGSFALHVPCSSPKPRVRGKRSKRRYAGAGKSAR